MHTMRQLLSRKNHSQRMTDRDQGRDQNRGTSPSTPGPCLPPLDLAGERVFPIRNARGTSEIPWLMPTVQGEGTVSRCWSPREDPAADTDARSPMIASYE